MSWDIREGDCLDVLRELDAGSIQTCVTSPPYWGLRDYGTATWEGGDSECDHRSGPQDRNGRETPGGRGGSFPPSEHPRQQCRCGAKRIDSQLGLEPTPEQYVENLVTVFRGVRRVLREDGTVWLNLGDSYFGAGRGPSNVDMDYGLHQGQTADGGFPTRGVYTHGTLKSKDLCGIPWRVAFALHADGWWLRSDIIWAKPNPMPESVTDRPTRAHEYIFLLSKSARYFYDADAIREGFTGHPTGANGSFNGVPPNLVNQDRNDDGAAVGRPDAVGRNRRSVWTVTTQPYSEAHFATFPPKLIEPCILAGSPPKCCGECGAPWERILEPTKYAPPSAEDGERFVDDSRGDKKRKLSGADFNALGGRQTLGWRSTCKHDDDSGHATVLDPFAGAGTTGLEATQHGRDFIGIELNPEYAEMARERIRRYEANPAGALEGDPDPIEGQLGFL